jgi:tetratricopeptide (TPR) repeat protein
MTDRDLHLARALLVDGNALLRSVTAAQLRDAGIGHVTAVSRSHDARLLLEREQFDIVICNRESETDEDAGQDLLDELRRERLLPHATVFLMIASSATYVQVVEAAESALDALLIRPYSGTLLMQRLAEARARKRELAPVLRSLDAGELEPALVRALKRFSERAPYWSYCGRMAAELMLRLDRPDEAGKLFDKLLLEQPKAIWARLGTARSRIAVGDLSGARKILKAVLNDERDCADAHDLTGRLLVEQCDFDEALEHYRAAAKLTPGCLLRQQHAGALAFYQGDDKAALSHFERALSLGVKSKLFDALTLLMIAFLRFDAGDTIGVAAMRDELRRFRARFALSHRLQRLSLGVDALHGSLLGQPAGHEALRSLMAALDEDEFDLEAAAVVLAVARRLPRCFESPTDYERMVQRVGTRFASSKAITETLVAAAGRVDPAAGLLRACHAEISGLAEAAVGMNLAGRSLEAVQQLLHDAARTRNVRLAELARSLCRRHLEQRPEFERLLAEAQELLQRLGHHMNHIAGIQRTGRSPGAMVLRGPAERGNTAAHAVLPASDVALPVD